MVFAADETILTNPDQTDWWSVTHVLIPFFGMFYGLEWYIVLLLIYFAEGIEALPAVSGTTVTDGLIVDPVQALLGILTFICLEKLGFVTPIVFPTMLKQLTRTFFFQALAWVPILATVITIARTKQYEYEWIYIIDFTFMAAILSYYNENVIGKILVIVYTLVLSSTLTIVNRIPYNPFYTSLWFHIFLIPTFLWIIATKRKKYIDYNPIQITKEHIHIKMPSIQTLNQLS